MPGHYDLWTVVLSFLIASLSGFVAFESVEHRGYSARPAFWTFAGGFTLGLGIWSMHFVGMLAWHPPFRLYYQLGPTFLSVIAAIGASWLALHLAVRTTATTPALAKFAGALVVGSGICAMHYIGMSALHFSIPETWDRAWLLLSFLIAVGASWVAIELLVRSLRTSFGISGQLYASLLIGTAICGMHYSGMHAMMLPPNSVAVAVPVSFTGAVLGRVGVGNSLIFAFGLLIVFYHDKAQWVRVANDARFQAQEASRNADRLAAAAKIAATVAHEINNPLEAMTNLLYLIEHGEIGPVERSYLELAQQELKRIGEITTHTLKFHRQQSGPEQTSIPALFESALSLFRKRIEAAPIHVDKEWPAELPTVLCRAGEIRQVLANLVGNAVDAMSTGGTLRIGITPVGESLHIEVEDTGNGIPAEVQSKVLEPFFTTKGAAGTGLGLAISADIIARHHGTLTFTSSTEAGRSGTCFRIVLPCAPTSIESPA